MASDAFTRIYELQVKLSQQSKKALEDLQKSVGDVHKSMQSFKEMAGGLLDGILAGASVGAFFSKIQDTISSLDEMADAAARLGIAPDVLSEMAYAAEQADVEFGELTTGMKEFGKTIFAAGKTGSKENKIFAALGIDPTGKDTVAVLEEFADKFNEIGDAATQNQLLLEAFGKAGLAMRPMMEGGSEGIRAARQEAQAFGIVLTEDLAKAIGEYDTNTKKLKAATQGLWTELVKGLLPALVNIQEAFIGAGDSGTDFSVIGKAVGATFQGIASFAFDCWQTIVVVGKSFGALGAAIAAFVSGDFGQMPAIWDAWKDDMHTIDEQTAAFHKKLREGKPVVDDDSKAKEKNARMTKKVAEAMHEAKKETEKYYEAQKQASTIGGLISDTDIGKLIAFEERLEKIDALFQSGFDTSGTKLSIAQLDALRIAYKNVEDQINKLLGIQSMKTIEEQYEAWEKAQDAAYDYATTLRTLIDLETDPIRKQRLEEFYDATVKGANKASDANEEVLKGMEKLLKDIADSTDTYSQNLSSSLVDIATSAGEAKDAFADFVINTLKGISQMALQLMVVKPLFDYVKMSMGFAEGGVFENGMQKFASGGIVATPTIFPMATGRMGLMGEAGPEAILPLSRGAGGRLGVVANDGGSSGITVVVNNNNNSQVKVEEGKDANGEQSLEITIDSMVEKSIGKGRFDRIMSTTYGVSRRGK